MLFENERCALASLRDAFSDSHNTGGCASLTTGYLLKSLRDESQCLPDRFPVVHSRNKRSFLKIFCIHSATSELKKAVDKCGS